MNRMEQVQAVLQENEAALITSGANRFYLTHFPSSAGAILVTKRAAYAIIDFRYVEKARATIQNAEVILMQSTYAQVGKLMQEAGATVLYVETESMSLAEFQAWQTILPGILLQSDGKLDHALTDARAIKDAEEVANMRVAQEMTDATFSYILERITPGRTEREVMLDMEFYMRRLGSEGVAFDFIVVSGQNSSLPHGVPTDKKIERGDFVTMDFGAAYHGYLSDMTRTVAVGEVSDEQKKVYETVQAAQAASLATIRAGVPCKAVDAAARDLIYGAGYTGCFGHGLGHSVGVEIHESPACNTRSEACLQTGMIMTVEPGIYLENRFGVRIEDMVWVRENGYENLTKSEKKLLIL